MSGEVSRDAQERRILVVGAATGIGRATASRLADDGARIALLDVQADQVQFLKRDLNQRGGRSSAFVVDVRHEDSVIDAVRGATEWLEGLDAVVYSAGIQAARGVAIEHVESTVWDDLMAVNLRGAYLVAKYVTLDLEQSGGALILVSSGAGIFGGSGSHAYGASKGGMHGLALTLEQHLTPRGIRVNEVAPGWIDTPLLRAQVGDQEADKAGSAEGVASVISFLTTPDAQYVRGIVRTR